jgi:hypothetical protein
MLSCFFNQKIFNQKSPKLFRFTHHFKLSHTLKIASSQKISNLSLDMIFEFGKHNGNIVNINNNTIGELHNTFEHITTCHFALYWPNWIFIK